MFVSTRGPRRKHDDDHGSFAGQAPALRDRAEAARFDYDNAFSRNIGWVTRDEQLILRDKCVAIAGLGGVGGAHLMTLARLGVGRFRIADLDIFEEANVNRQVGATRSSFGRPKVEVMAEQARSVNPELVIESFPSGVSGENVSAFLSGADLYIDGLDFFVMDVRRKVFAACAEQNVPATTVAPLGMGAALLNFLPGAMTFEEYFRLEGQSEAEQLLRFMVGLAPAALHGRALVDPSTIDLAGHRGPSTAMACQLCAGIAGSEALKILLRRGPVRAAPWALQFDAYRNRMVTTYRPWGNRHPLQRLTLAVARRRFLRSHGDQLANLDDRAADDAKEPAPAPAIAKPSPSTAEQVLETARWAPSGANLQPWSFEITGDDEVIVTGRDSGGTDVYDFNDSQPSWTTFGCLLETLRIGASKLGRVADWTFEGSNGSEHRFRVALQPRAGLVEDPLARHIVSRSVDRRAYRTTPLSDAHKRALERAAGEQHSIDWRESLSERLACARLNSLSSDIRLRIREAHEAHQRMLDWTHDRSATAIPAKALGADAITLALTRWALVDFRRLDLLNRYLAGTLVPRVTMDLLPGIRCAAHFFMKARCSGSG